MVRSLMQDQQVRPRVQHAVESAQEFLLGTLTELCWRTDHSADATQPQSVHLNWLAVEQVQTLLPKPSRLWLLFRQELIVVAQHPGDPAEVLAEVAPDRGCVTAPAPTQAASRRPHVARQDHSQARRRRQFSLRTQLRQPQCGNLAQQSPTL